METQSETEQFVGQQIAYPSEPEYDAERLKSDVLYRNVTVAAFTKHMKMLRDSSLRVDYFMRMAKALNMFLRVCPDYLLAQQRSEPYNHQTLLDEDGNGIEQQLWHCNFINPLQEKGIFNKAYFFENYPSLAFQKDALQIPSLDELKNEFLQKPRSEEYIRLLRRNIASRIESTQRDVNDWIDNMYRCFGDTNSVKQCQDASELIEGYFEGARETKGVGGIVWSLFQHENQLVVFAKLWDLVAFKVFLKNPIQAQPNNLTVEEVNSKTPNLAEFNSKLETTIQKFTEFQDQINYLNNEKHQLKELKKHASINDVDSFDRLLDAIEQLMNRLPPIPEAEVQPVNKGKKPQAHLFANFTDKLQNGFTEKDLNDLLVHVNFKNPHGKTLRFTKYLMHHIIDALIKEEYFEGGNREKDQKALCRYLGIEETRVTVEHGASKKSVRKKAEAYLVELKNQRKING